MTARKKNDLPKRLAISAAVATTFLVGYGSRQAYAGTCTGAAGTYTCSGAANAGTDVDQTLSSGTNPLSVTTTAGFGITAPGNAITLQNSAGGTTLNFTDTNTSFITGAYVGINAINSGTGATSITSTGTVTGAINIGIFARNNTSATNVTISAADVSGGSSGIFAQNSGKGATSITSTGAVMGTAADGIYVFNNSLTSTNITISTAAVSGGSNGIFAQNAGAGAISITSTGAVTGATGRGIYAYNGLGTSLTINSAAVSGATAGIRASNKGSGATSITSTGTVSATTDAGVYAYNGLNATDITINTAAVTGNTGITVRNRGKGATSVTSTGTVTATQGGIRASNTNLNSTNLTINTAAVTGGEHGIYASNYGTGATSITSTGTVTGGVNYYGIQARNLSASSNLTINAAAVTGGIFADNAGKGATSITSTGAVTGGNYGIFTNNSAVTSLTINTTAAVTGSAFGIYAANNGTGSTNITVSSAVTGSGAGGVGIASNALNGNTMTLNSGASVSAASGNAINLFGSGANSVAVNNGASVTGSVSLGSITNAITLNGGSLNVANGFALNVIGSLINTNGTVNLQNNAIDVPATVSGNFTGGGQLLVDANFATNTADKLNITGNVLAGGTRVGVHDISTGPATGNAITLVSVGGTTTTGDFTLAAPVVNGAYNYNTLALVANDWILQSVAAASPTPSTQAFTPFAASFEAMSQSLLTLANLPSLIGRTDGRIGGSKTGASSGDKAGIDTPIWLRFAGGYRDVDSSRSSTGANFDTNHWLAQVGIDFTVADNANGRFVAGVNAGYNKADTDIKSTAGKSNLDTTGHSIGLTGTWYGVNGVYVDTQLQRSWYDTDLSASGVGAGKVNGVDADGYSVSIEAGKKISLNETLNIIPQAQLVYANVDSDKFTGANAEIVKLSTSKSLKARLGAALNKLFTPDGATRGFILANVMREFEDETQVNVSGTQLTNAVDRWTGELGLGLNHAWTQGNTSYELTAAVSGSSSLNNFGDSKAAQGQVHFKASF